MITSKACLKTIAKVLPMLLILAVLFSCKYKQHMHMAKEEGPLYDRVFDSYSILESYYNDNQSDSLEAFAPEVMAQCKKHQFWRLYYLAWELLGDDAAFRGDYERAMTIAHEMEQDAQQRNCNFGLSEANQLTGLIFALQHNYKEGAHYFEEAIHLYDREIGGIQPLADLYFRYTEALRNAKAKDGRLDSALVAWKELLDRYMTPQDDSNLYFKYYDIKSTDLLDKKKYDEALVAIDSADYYSQKWSKTYTTDLMILNDRIEILYEKGDYQQAMKWINIGQHVIDSLEQAGSPAPISTRSNLEEIRHLVNAAQNNYKEAYLSKVKHDSLNTLLYNEASSEQTQQLNKRYDVDEMQRQNKQLQQRSRFTTGGVAMVLGIIAMLVFLTTSNRWRHTLEVKNRQLERERNVVVAQNKQLSVERDRAEAASKAKTAFLQSMTHEIRTPLNAISGFTQVLTMPGMTLPENERLDFSERIQENTRLLTNILDDLILISNMEGQQDLSPAEPTLALGLVATAADAVGQQLSPEVTIDIVCDMPEEETIMTHPTQINIVLQKLLDNAAKFTKRGLITLALHREGDSLHFTVSDTGPGIPEDKRDFIFERFTKLDSFTQGTGLGLSIARMVAEHLGGTLTLDTSYTNGAKFDFIIPINPQA